LAVSKKQMASSGEPESPASRVESTMESGSATFWQTTFEQHGSAVMAFLSSRLGRRDLAEDLLQDTFVRVMRTRVPLRDPAKVRSYLFSTAHRLILNRRRRRPVLLFSELSQRDSGESVDLEAIGADQQDAGELTDLSRLRERLDEVLSELPPPHRRAFELVVLDQMSYAEVARQEGWSLDQVRMNVYRARKGAIARLRELLRVEEREVE
jgi:RNA polymerase sigma factor (sigma-70 family)